MSAGVVLSLSVLGISLVELVKHVIQQHLEEVINLIVTCKFYILIRIKENE